MIFVLYDELALTRNATVAARSDGEAVRAPRYYRARERKLRRAQRRLSRAQKGSRNRAKARRRVAKSMNARRTCAMSFCTSCLLSWS